MLKASPKRDREGNQKSDWVRLKAFELPMINQYIVQHVINHCCPRMTYNIANDRDMADCVSNGADGIEGVADAGE